MTATRRWLLGGIAGLVLVFLAGFLLVVNPARNSAAQTWDQVEATKQENVRLQAKIQQLQQQSAEVPAKLAEIESARKKLPAEIKQPELVRAIETQASNAGVDLTGIVPAAPAAVEGSAPQLVALPTDLTATGRYANIKTFVDNLERQERAFLINTIEVTASDTGTDTFTVSISGDYYTLPDGALETETGSGSTEPTPSPSDSRSTEPTPAPSDSPSTAPTTGAAAAKTPARAADKKATGKGRAERKAAREKPSGR